MTILKTRGVIANTIRDYMYDETVFGPSAISGCTVAEVTEALSSIKNGQTISAGVVRRTLNELRGAGILTLNDSVNPATYRWDRTAQKPADYKHRPVSTPTASVNQSGAPVATTMDDDQKKASLRGAIRNRMHEITGEKIQAAEQDAIVTPKKNPAKGIKRVNGQIYQPRELAGVPDVDALKRLRDNNIYALLAGPPGTGKTVLVDAAFGATGLHVVTGNENTTVEAFMGQWSPTGTPGEYFWVDGPLVNAMRNGEVLFVDDATLINPRVNAIMYPAMDGRGEVIVTDHIIQRPDGTMGPDIVKAAPGFYVVAAHNPGVIGAHLSDALASRFTARIWVETDLQLAMALGVTDRFIQLVRKLKVKQEKGQRDLWIPQLRELLTARDMARAFGEEIAAANLLGAAPEEDQPEVQDSLRVIFNKEILPLEIGGQL